MSMQRVYFTHRLEASLEPPVPCHMPNINMKLNIQYRDYIFNSDLHIFEVYKAAYEKSKFTKPKWNLIQTIPVIYITMFKRCDWKNFSVMISSPREHSGCAESTQKFWNNLIFKLVSKNFHCFPMILIVYFRVCRI